MGFILRTKDDVNNPTLPGGVYGRFITAGRGVYWTFDGSQTCGILFISDGGAYGLAGLTSFEYKGDILEEGVHWIFHPGTLPAQKDPKTISGINTSTNVVTVTSHGFVNGNFIRFASSDGSLPLGLLSTLKYLVSDKTTNTFKVKDAEGTDYIDFTDSGTGDQTVWLANTGFDDATQGLPTFCPEVNTCFSNIAYVEFKLPTNRSTAGEQPDWGDFRAVGIGRKLMDYDEYGSDVGITDDVDLLSNVALQIADNALNSLNIASSRINWQSWKDLRDSAATKIWQRVVVTDDAPDLGTPTGFTARYYQNQDFTNLRVTRTDVAIDMGGNNVTPPAPGVTPNGFSVRWTGRIKPAHSELYTITAIHDDTIAVWINGQLIIASSDYGTHTGTFAFEADTLYDIQVELVQWTVSGTNNWEARLKWQSASQSLQIIPSSVVYASDEPVNRYECHIAFPFAIEAGEVHERLMERCPGWHWTDNDGQIEFLGPDREVSFSFELDRIDDDSQANFVKASFQKKRRLLAERRNFLLFRYRNVRNTGFPFAFVQADRPELRRFTNGEPTNDPATDLGVSTMSLADRMGEMEMVFKTDPEHTATISGARASSKIRKNHIVTLSYYDNDGNYVADDRYLVTFHSWGASNEKNDFSLLPIPEVFYTDEPYVAP